jgi:hypothetical protein
MARTHFHCRTFCQHRRHSTVSSPLQVRAWSISGAGNSWWSPRPQMDLDSPPPSPPPAAADRGGDRLPVLLQPADSSDDTPRLNPEPHVSPQKNLVSLLPDCSIIKRMKEYFHIRRYGLCLLCPFAVYYPRYAVRSFFIISRIRQKSGTKSTA